MPATGPILCIIFSLLSFSHSVSRFCSLHCSPCVLHLLDAVFICLVIVFLYKCFAACFFASACRGGRCDRCLWGVKAVRLCLSQGIWGDHYLWCTAYIVLLPVMAVTDTTSDSMRHYASLPFRIIGGTNACHRICRYSFGFSRYYVH